MIPCCSHKTACILESEEELPPEDATTIKEAVGATGRRSASARLPTLLAHANQMIE